mmetsp:Transcript_3843/g.11770  ORF Transcript_3843/g.11770 Transcript_3843/m.11770 type:complete len:332 (-) Transcript_3843:1713-2708(-)
MGSAGNRRAPNRAGRRRRLCSQLRRAQDGPRLEARLGSEIHVARRRDARARRGQASFKSWRRRDPAAAARADGRARARDDVVKSAQAGAGAGEPKARGRRRGGLPEENRFARGRGGGFEGGGGGRAGGAGAALPGRALLQVLQDAVDAPAPRCSRAKDARRGLRRVRPRPRPVQAGARRGGGGGGAARRCEVSKVLQNASNAPTPRGRRPQDARRRLRPGNPRFARGRIARRRPRVPEAGGAIRAAAAERGSDVRAVLQNAGYAPAARRRGAEDARRRPRPKGAGPGPVEADAGARGRAGEAQGRAQAKAAAQAKRAHAAHLLVEDQRRGL